MKVGTKVTYTQKGYATDFIVKINNKFVNPTLITKEEVYTQRKGIITNIKKWASGSVTYTVKWEDVGGYWEDDESVVYREDIQEIKKEEVVEEKAPITTNEETMKKQITKKNWHIVTKEELTKMPWASANKVSHKPDAWDADAWIDEVNKHFTK